MGDGDYLRYVRRAQGYVDEVLGLGRLGGGGGEKGGWCQVLEELRRRCGDLGIGFPVVV